MKLLTILLLMISGGVFAQNAGVDQTVILGQEVTLYADVLAAQGKGATIVAL